MTTNYLTLHEGLKIFRDAMLPFIVEKLQPAYGDNWWEQGVTRCFKPEDIERLGVLFEKRHDSLVVERPGDEWTRCWTSTGSVTSSRRNGRFSNDTQQHDRPGWAA